MTNLTLASSYCLLVKVRLKEQSIEYKTGYNSSVARPRAYTHAIGQGNNTKRQRDQPTSDDTVKDWSGGAA